MANEIVVKVNADITRAKAAFKDIKARMEGFSKGARTAGIALSAMGAAGALAIKSFVSAAMEQERAIKTLASSVESTGVNFDTVKSKIMDTTAALQDKTNFGDEAQIRVLTILTTILGDVDQAMAALPAVMDASAASGLKMESVAKTMGKALGGQVHQAESVGLVFDKTAGFGERLALVLGKVGGAAEADVDPFRQLGNDLGDLKETIGAALIPILLPLVDGLRGIFKRLQEMNPAIVQAGAVALALGTAIGLIGGPILLIISMIPALVAGIGMVTAAWMTLAGATGIGAVIIILGLLTVAFITKFDLIKEIVGNALNWIIEKIVEWGRKIAGPIDIIIETLNEISAFTIPTLSQALDKLDTVTIDWGRKTQDAAEQSRGHMEQVATSVANVGDEIDRVAHKTDTVLAPAMERLSDSMDDPFLEYGQLLQDLGREMDKNILDLAHTLKKEHGGTLEEALDDLSRAQMQHLKQRRSEFTSELLGHGGIDAPTFTGGGAGVRTGGGAKAGAMTVEQIMRDERAAATLNAFMVSGGDPGFFKSETFLSINGKHIDTALEFHEDDMGDGGMIL